MAPLLELERQLAGAVCLDDLTGSVLQGLQRLVGASGSTLFCFDQPGVVTNQGGTLAAALREYPLELFEDDETWQVCKSYPAQQFIHFADARAEALLSKSRAHAEFYRPHDIGFICGVWPTGLCFGARDMFGVLLCTPALSSHFEPRDFASLGWLEVPLRSAAHRIARFRALQSKAQVLEQLLEREQGAFALWNPAGQLVCVSPQAQRLLQTGLSRGELQQAARLAWRQLRRGERAERDALLGRARELRSSSGAQLSVEFSWIAAPDGSPWLLAQLSAAIGPRARLALLTKTERRVLRSLARGLSNQEIGEALAVSRETIKTHVGRILAKLAVSSRLEAATVARDAWERS